MRLAGACVVLLLSMMPLLACSGDDDDDASSSTTRISVSSTSTSVGRSGGEKVVSGGFSEREPSLEILSGADTLTLTSTDLGDDAYRVAVPARSPASPSAQVDNGNVVVSLEPSSGDAPVAVDVQLARDRRWTLRLAGGGRDAVVDFAEGDLAGLAFAAGTTSIEVTLPAPTGTVPVHMAGGATTFAVHAPEGVPVQVRFGAGAGSTEIDGESREGVESGTIVTPTGWEAAGDRYDIELGGGVQVFTVDRD